MIISSENLTTTSELTQAYELARSILKDNCKNSLFKFLKNFWHIATGEPYQHNWHVPYICGVLQENFIRLINRQPALYDWIIVNVPPGTSKSTIASIMTPAWAWVHDPSLRGITGSFDSKLATRLAVCSRDVILSEDYQSFWGDEVKLKSDSNNKTVYNTTKSGTRMTCSTRSGITGNHGHFVGIDDALDPQGEKSEAEVEAVLNWINKTLPSRILNDETALKYLIMQRLGEQDPVGHLLKKEGLNILHICLPAEITEHDNISPPELKKYYRDDPKEPTGKNDLMDPIRKGRRVLRKRKADLGSGDYDTQYNQNTEALKGNIWKRKWWRYYRELPNERLIRLVQSWDTAFDEKEINDPWCGTEWAQYASGYYLTDFILEKFRTPEGIKQIVLWDSKSHPHNILIEKKASGIVALQILEDETTLPLVHDIIPIKSKPARAMAATPTVEAGNVYLPINAPYTSDLVNRLAKFPNGLLDDDSDSIAQFLNWVREQKSGYFKLDSVMSSKPKLNLEGF